MVSKSNRLPIVIVSFAAIFLIVLLIAGMSGVSAAPNAQDISMSTKSVNKAEALIGDSLSYTIVITNSGDANASFSFTDTLPANVSYIADSLSVQVTNAFTNSAGVSGSTVSVAGSLSTSASNPEVTITFDAMIGSGVVSGTMITNTAQVGDGTTVYNISASTQVVSQTQSLVYLPIILKPFPAPTLNGTVPGGTSGANYDQSWSVTWNQIQSGITYEIQEASDRDFNTILSTATTTSPSRTYNHSASYNNQYFYRVRVSSGSGSGWSNAVEVIGAYRDDFTTSNGGWLKVRQDLDDTQNVLSYVRPENWLKLHVQGRWDYMIASSLRPTPAGDYQFETNVKFAGAGNLNTYGLILGADWNGDTCPTLIPDPGPATRSVDEAQVILDPNEQEESMSPDGTDSPNRAVADVVDNCFNHYYRIKLMWFGKDNRYKLQVKRIDYHSEPKNSGRGVSLVSTTEVPIDDQNGWNSWRVEVKRSTGEFKLYGNNELRATWTDTTYINDVYWGVFADDDEYPGSDPWFEYINVRPLP